MAGYGDYPFGMRQIVIEDLGGGNPVALPAARQLGFTERLISGELRGNDSLKEVAAIVEAVEWSLEAGGISLEAWAKLTGRTATESGTTPNLVNTLTGSAGDVYPYVQMSGRSMGATGADDIHAIFYKAKVTSPLQGTFQDGEFFVTQCSGIGVDDDVNGVWDLVQHETAEAIPEA